MSVTDSWGNVVMVGGGEWVEDDTELMVVGGLDIEDVLSPLIKLQGLGYLKQRDTSCIPPRWAPDVTLPESTRELCERKRTHSNPT